MSNQLDKNKNMGFIKVAIDDVIQTRMKNMNDQVTDLYEWVVRANVSDELGYEFTIKEKIFTKMSELNLSYSEQENILMDYIYEMIEEKLIEENISIPRIGYMH